MLLLSLINLFSLWYFSQGFYIVFFHSWVEKYLIHMNVFILLESSDLLSCWYYEFLPFFFFVNLVVYKENYKNKRKNRMNYLLKSIHNINFRFLDFFLRVLFCLIPCICFKYILHLANIPLALKRSTKTTILSKSSIKKVPVAKICIG